MTPYEHQLNERVKRDLASLEKHIGRFSYIHNLDFPPNHAKKLLIYMFDACGSVCTHKNLKSMREGGSKRNSMKPEDVILYNYIPNKASREELQRITSFARGSVFFVHHGEYKENWGRRLAKTGIAAFIPSYSPEEIINTMAQYFNGENY